MIPQPSKLSSFFKRVLIRLGLDSKQKSYFFYMPNLKSERGSLIALAAVFMVVVAISIPVALTVAKDVRTNTQQAQLYVAGAQNAAKAGLEDALGYFVRQNTVLRALNGTYTYLTTPTPTAFATPYTYVDQPFNPSYNPSNPQYSDTFQATTVNLAGGMTNAFYGICNEYPIDALTNTLIAAGAPTISAYFARYEVQEQVNPVATTGVTFTPNPMAVHDISGTRETNYMNGDGLTWAITSTGYIYQRYNYNVDSYGEYTLPYNVYPNKVLATAKAYTEFRKLTCTLPNSSAGDAAAYCTTASNVELNGYSYMGGAMAKGYGLCAMSGSATAPTGASSNNFFGNGVVINSATNAPISDVSVFGMSLRDIQFIADYVGSTSPNIPLSIVSANKLSYFNGNLTYSSSSTQTVYQRLNSSGILIVNGNLTLSEVSGATTIQPSYYSGIIFVTGNMTIGAGCDVDGVVIMGYSSVDTNPGGNLCVQGDSSTGNFAYLTADPTGVANVMQQVAQYREDISARKILLAYPGI
jgi:hypothetical protein